jgi:hypothetical protein
MAVEVKLNPLGLVDPKKQKAVLDAKDKASAPKSTPKPSTNPAFTQTLNLYGSPASNTARTSTVSQQTGGTKGSTKQPAKKAPDTKAAIDARIAATNAKIDAAMGPVKSYVEGMGYVIDPVTGLYVSGSPTGGGSGGQEQPDDQKTPAKKEVIPNVAYDTIEAILKSYNITDIASVLNTIRDEYPEASSEDVLTLLQFDSRYNAKFNARFAANVERQKAGKPVLSPAEYLKLEQGYISIFNAYNLPTFKSQSYYDKFIKEDLDVVEVTDRVQLAYDRVLNDQSVKSAFNKFFSSLGFSDIVAGMLDPVNQIPALERKVKAAEIGGAALRQGLTASELAMTEAQANVPFSNVTRGTLGADVLGQEGVTKAQAEAGFRKIAEVLPTAEKLSSIYGGTEEQYGRLEAEQEQLQGLASAARKRQRLAELETAQFRKSSGLGRGALSSLNNI